MSAIPTTRTGSQTFHEINAQVQAEAEAGRRKARRKHLWKSLAANVAVLLFLLFAVFPLYFVVTASFRPGQSLYSTSLEFFPSHPSLENWTYMFTQTKLLLWMWNSLQVAGLTTVASVLLCTTAAYAFSRWRFLGRDTILTLMLAINAFPGVLALIGVFVIFKEMRIQFDVAGQHIDLRALGSLWGLVLAYTAGQLIFSTWNLKGFFDTIPVDLEEAARVDGATPTQAFIRVMLPLARPALAVTALLGFMGGWGEYITAQTLLFDESKYTVAVGLIGLQDNYRQPWGWFAVGAICMSVPVTLLFLALQKQLQAGLTLGGVKG
ncbi:MAG: sugar ABC transporter permease [Chloroflexota bacterium]|nr:sugar ABC transporter permease [Chloroflexota bacterium]